VNKKNKKIHVLYIITKLELGGAQKVCLSLLNGINQSSDQRALLLSGNTGPLVQDVQNNKHVFLLDSFKREVGIKTIFLEIKSFFSIIRIIKKLKKKYPDIIIHTHSTKAGIMGRWAAFFAGIKKRMHTVHGFGFNEYQSTLRWYFIYILEYLTSLITTHYVCVSKKDQLEGVKRFPNFKQKSSLIRAAVAWDTFFLPAKQTNFFDTQKSFTIGTIACFKPQKNIFDLLKAFKQTHQKVAPIQLNLEIIGDGEQRPHIEAWIKNNNLTSAITLLGWQHDVRQWLHSWNLFVLSSLWEGLPCAVIEARLSKIPVIAYNVGGINEVVFNNKNGFIIKPGDWQTLANKISHLITNPNLYKQTCLYPDDLSDFNNKNMIKKHLDLYHKLV